jgi:hypothetical protein
MRLMMNQMNILKMMMMMMTNGFMMMMGIAW